MGELGKAFPIPRRKCGKLTLLNITPHCRQFTER
jgi:hypothetical protein